MLSIQIHTLLHPICNNLKKSRSTEKVPLAPDKLLCHSDPPAFHSHWRWWCLVEPVTGVKDCWLKVLREGIVYVTDCDVKLEYFSACGIRYSGVSKFIPRSFIKPLHVW